MEPGIRKDEYFEIKVGEQIVKVCLAGAVSIFGKHQQTPDLNAIETNELDDSPDNTWKQKATLNPTNLCVFVCVFFCLFLSCGL